MKARGNSLCHTDLTYGVDAVFITRPSPRGSTTSLCWGLASRTLEPLWLIGQKLTRSHNINDSMSCRERVEEESHSLQCPMGGQRKTDREGGRTQEVTTGHTQASSILLELRFSSRPQVFHSKHLRTTPSFSCYYRVFQFVDLKVIISPQVWKENQYTIQRKCVNHWTDGKRLARGRGSQQDHLQHVKWSGFQWWQTDKRSPQQPSVSVGRIHMLCL